jgi:hypothetical protein
MRGESAKQKFERLRGQIQNLMLTAYPNPARRGCPGQPAVEEIARRATAEEMMQGETVFEHIMRCSPCYGEFLAARQRLRGPREPAKRVPRPVEKRIGRALDRLDEVMKSAAKGH